MRKLALTVLLFAGSLFGQPLTTPVNVTPDCLIFFDFTTNGSSASFDNRFIGCKTFYVAYTNTGFPAITLTFEDAPDNNGVAGAFVAFAGTIVEGVNPNVALTQASTIMYGYYPWVRLTLTGATAGAGRRLRGTFYGYRQVPVTTILMAAAATVTANQGTAAVQANRWPVFWSNGATERGTNADPIRVDPTGTTAQPVSASMTPGDARANSGALISGGAQPLLVFPYLFNGATWDRELVCSSRAVISFAAGGAGSTQIVALVAAKSIRVCHISFSLSTPVDVKLVEGTGVNCAGGPADLTGAYPAISALALDLEPGSFIGTAANALCINVSAAATVAGMVTYAQY